MSIGYPEQPDSENSNIISAIMFLKAGVDCGTLEDRGNGKD